jgi:hypothetical protein
VLVARVRFYYPDVWRDAAYRTQSHVMPFPLFWLYATSLGATLAFDRLQHARAVASAVALSFGKKEDGMPESVRMDSVDAYLLRDERGA